MCIKLCCLRSNIQMKVNYIKLYYISDYIVIYKMDQNSLS